MLFFYSRQITIFAENHDFEKTHVTSHIVEEAAARREAIVVTFIEVSKESYASGGELMIDRAK